MILYIKTGCPWCMKVLDYAKKHGIEFELKNIATPGVAEELIARGGKRQVPYLADANNAVEMYESADIVEYLQKRLVE
ncbi:MAG: glutathione S-transferase N-terminal domain-containing protein [Patescibacteria group bacterium]